MESLVLGVLKFGQRGEADVELREIDAWIEEGFRYIGHPLTLDDYSNNRKRPEHALACSAAIYFVSKVFDPFWGGFSTLLYDYLIKELPRAMVKKLADLKLLPFDRIAFDAILKPSASFDTFSMETWTRAIVAHNPSIYKTDDINCIGLVAIPMQTCCTKVQVLYLKNQPLFPQFYAARQSISFGARCRPEQFRFQMVDDVNHQPAGMGHITNTFANLFLEFKQYFQLADPDTDRWIISNTRDIDDSVFGFMGEVLNYCVEFGLAKLNFHLHSGILHAILKQKQSSDHLLALWLQDMSEDHRISMTAMRKNPSHGTCIDIMTESYAGEGNYPLWPALRPLQTLQTLQTSILDPLDSLDHWMKDVASNSIFTLQFPGRIQAFMSALLPLSEKQNSEKQTIKQLDSRLSCTTIDLDAFINDIVFVGHSLRQKAFLKMLRSLDQNELQDLLHFWGGARIKLQGKYTVLWDSSISYARAKDMCYLPKANTCFRQLRLDPKHFKSATFLRAARSVCSLQLCSY